MENKRIISIEGLRGMAMLFVVFSHFFYRFIADFCGRNISSAVTVLHIEYWGALGVSVFFLISGYFIVNQSEKSKVMFLLKRIVRLWPTYVISITITFILSHMFYLPGRTVGFCEFFLNLFFINGFTGMPYVDGSHWYITILLGTSFIFCFIYQKNVQNRHYFYWMWLALDIFFCMARSDNRIIDLFFGGVSRILGQQSTPILILGAVIADFKQKRIGKIGWITALFCLITKYIWGREKFLIMCCGLIIFLLTIYNFLGFLNCSFFTYLGKISFPVYLIHQNLGYILMWQIVARIGKYSVWMSLLAVGLAILEGQILYFADWALMTKSKSILRVVRNFVAKEH